MDGWASEVIEGVASESPAAFEEALGNLELLSEIILERLEVDQVKTYLVRRSPEGPVWWLLSTPGGERTSNIEYSPTRGLADYVIRTGEGLLATGIPAVPLQWPGKGPVLEVTFLESPRPRGKWSLRTGYVEARSNSELEEQGDEEDGPGDPESTLLYMPVRTDSKVSAVIGVSRHRGPGETRPENLTLDDAKLLEAVSPALAMACQRCLNFEKLDEHFQVLTSLGRELGACVSLTHAYAIVAQMAGKFAEASAAALLEQVGEEEHYLGLGTWQTADDASPSGSFAFLAVSATVDEICRALTRQIPGCSFRQMLRAETHSGGRKRVLLLFDGEVPGPELSYFSDRLFERYSEIFFQSACEALDGFVGRLGKRVVDRLVGPGEGEVPLATDSPRETTLALLTQAARLLREATGVERIRIYSGREGHRVLADVPGQSGLESPGLGRDIWRRLQQRQRIWEVSPSSVESGQEERVSVRAHSTSRRVLPVLFGKRLVGAFEMFSAENGAPVGLDHGDLAEMVARQASWEVRRALRHAALERINHDLGKLEPAEGQNLGQTVARALREWGREIFVRPDCEAVLLARSLRSGVLMSASTFDQPPEELSGRHELFESSAIWSKASAAPTPRFRAQGGCGITAPIRISADPRLQGVIALLDREAFEEEEREILVEAARFLAVFLQGERERNDVRLDMGLFRHAALGAIQGLTSSGLALADLVGELGGSPETLAEAEQLERIIRRESEQLRLWRQNQRFYLGNARPELRRWLQPVKPLLENYLRRYEPAATLRGLKVHRDLPPHELQLSLDERAFDVAISNLLDNAVKYAFKDREITLGMKSGSEGVEIWVEDVGHGIPKGAEQDIFERDQRLHRKDPFRVIAGQGLGLALVKSIIEAHDGSIAVGSQQEGRGGVSEKTPHRVRFTILLPWGQ